MGIEIRTPGEKSFIPSPKPGPPCGYGFPRKVPLLYPTKKAWKQELFPGGGPKKFSAQFLRLLKRLPDSALKNMLDDLHPGGILGNEWPGENLLLGEVREHPFSI
jgi:hypothetical protein